MFRPERQSTQFLVSSGDFYSLSQLQGVAHYKTIYYSYQWSKKYKFFGFLARFNFCALEGTLKWNCHIIKQEPGRTNRSQLHGLGHLPSLYISKALQTIHLIFIQYHCSLKIFTSIVRNPVRFLLKFQVKSEIK